MKFSRWYIDISFSDHFVVLMHFQVASLAVEVPARAPLERRGNHRLRWVKFNKFAIHVNPGRTEDSTFVHSKEICICNHAAPVHFEFEKLIAIDPTSPAALVAGFDVPVPYALVGIGAVAIWWHRPRPGRDKAPPK